MRSDVDMRKPRTQILSGTAFFHKMWKGHNGEPVLKTDWDKDTYLEALNSTFTEGIRQHVLWFSFCLMGNHPHETGRCLRDTEGSTEESVGIFGNWMRNAHSKFGRAYNDNNDRHGKVSNERPKTTEIDDDEGVLTVMFDGDANPVHAGLVSHPSRYRYSSHRFYALGERSAHTEHLTPPPVYLALGKTAETRRRRYRKLCDQYLRRAGLINDRPEETSDVLHLDEDRESEGDGASMSSETANDTS